MNLYKNHTHREILAVLEQSDKLTYEAKLNLLNEIDKRSIDAPTDELQSQINQKEVAINNLDYLKDIGFMYTMDENTGTITIRRASGAKLMDIAAVVVGVILSLVGLIHCWLLLAIFTGSNEFTLTKLFTYVFMISLGLIGFKMLGGINRFLDYNSFLFVQQRDTVTIKKGDIKDEQTFNTADLKLKEEGEDELILSAGEIEIMRTSPHNLVQKLTMEALLHNILRNQ
jgi:hypothetical protein